MPKLAKVLKDLFSIKEKLESATSSVSLSEECSSAIQKNLPQKEGNPLQPRANTRLKAQRRELDKMRSIVRSGPRIAELLSQLGSWSKVGSGSGVRGESGSGEGGDDDEGEDDDADEDEKAGH
ncbi:hypothetical protein Tco_0657293 [Tanacetum coccineum]|uniref:Uncharacterized protein n=1 Tax=Tanacetum coccineum TaxID=301880 RepID=A0ABQ4XB58_9ASTR